MSPPDDLVTRLQKIPLFRRIDPASLGKLCAFLTEERYADGELVFRERDPSGSMFAIESGHVEVSKVIDWDDMTEKTLAVLPPGAFFGEGGILENDPRSANVRARGEARLIRLDRAGLLEVLEHSPMAAIQVLFGMTRIINKRLRQTSHELVTLFDTGRLAGEGHSLDELCVRVLERCVESTGATKGAVFLVNPYTEALEVGAVHGVAVAGPLARDAGLFGRVLGEGRPVMTRDFTRLGLAPQGFEPASLVACPVTHQDRPVGMLLIGDREGGAAFNGGHLHLLQGIALQVGPAIQHARQKAEDAAEAAHHRHYVTF